METKKDKNVESSWITFDGEHLNCYVKQGNIMIDLCCDSLEGIKIKLEKKRILKEDKNAVSKRL